MRNVLQLIEGSLVARRLHDVASDLLQAVQAMKPAGQVDGAGFVPGKGLRRRQAERQGIGGFEGGDTVGDGVGFPEAVLLVRLVKTGGAVESGPVPGDWSVEFEIGLEV